MSNTSKIIGYTVIGIKELIDDLNKTTKKLKQNDLNETVANAFYEYTQVQVESNTLGLAPLSSATIKISEIGDHTPMIETGEMMSTMKVKRGKTNKEGVEVGFFSRGSTRNRAGVKYSDIAALHHSGYRIPLTGEKGKNVRRFLGFHGINPSADKSFLTVPPRPFLFKSLNMFMNAQEYDRIVQEFMENL